MPNGNIFQPQQGNIFAQPTSAPDVSLLAGAAGGTPFNPLLQGLLGAQSIQQQQQAAQNVGLQRAATMEASQQAAEAQAQADAEAADLAFERKKQLSQMGIDAKIQAAEIAAKGRRTRGPFGRGIRPPTVKQVADAKQTISGISGANALLDQVFPLIRDDTVGLKGRGRGILEAGAAVFGAQDSIEPDVTELSNMLDLVKAQNWKVLLGSGSISDQERAFVSKLVNSLSLSDSVKVSTNKLKRIQKVLNRGKEGPTFIIKQFEKAGGDAGADNQTVLNEARDAIANGAPRDAVLDRLEEMGISAEDL